MEHLLLCKKLLHNIFTKVQTFCLYISQFSLFREKSGEITISFVTLLVVTFYSEEVIPGINQTGFTLQIFALFAKQINRAPTDKSNPHRYTTPQLNFSVLRPGVKKRNRNIYRDNQLATLLFVPRNNIFHTDGKYTLLYRRIGWNGAGCRHNFRVFFFNAKSPSSQKWERKRL